ncbi:MAG: hypothetical protein ACOC3Z_00375 [Nanoarchaeota archaeon]
MNKKAWVKIVEAFIAILILSGVLISLIGFSDFSKSDHSKNIQNIESSILYSIQKNNNYRSFIINDSLDSRVNIKESNKNLLEISSYIDSNKPEYLNCSTLICDIDSDCSIDFSFEKDIFVDSIIISNNLTHYNPKELKIFCWFIKQN